MTDEEAVLLAELRAISNNSASATRFDTGDDEAVADEEGSTEIKRQEKPKVEPTKKSSPFKKKSSAKNLKPKTETMGEDTPPKEEFDGVSSSGGGFKDPSAPKTFKGEFGGAAEDAELLAELRAISMKSGSSNRFDTSEEEDNEQNNLDSNNLVEMPYLKKNISNRSSSSSNNKKEEEEKSNDEVLPPWKRKGRKKSNKQAQSHNEQSTSGYNAKNESDDKKLPPWKQNTKTPKKNQSAFDNVEIKVTPKKNVETVIEKAVQPAMVVNELSSSLPSMSPPKSTFQGERGGAAEDADLLAELRAISMQSSSANRFESNDDDDTNVVKSASTQKKSTKLSVPEGKPIQPKTSSTSSNFKTEVNQSLPPWKRKNRKPKTNDTSSKPLYNVDIIEPSQNSASKEEIQKVEGTKNSLPSSKPLTISNDGRSGSAEDADLLAELRAISMRSSVDRFSNDDVDESSYPEVKSETKEKPVTKSKPKTPQEKVPSPKADSENNLPPWKREKKFDANKPISDPFDGVTIEAPKNDIGESVNLKEPVFNKAAPPSTFQGERGGIAEDAALLAELKAISQQSSSGRFQESNETGSKEMTETSSPPKRKSASVQKEAANPIAAAVKKETPKKAPAVTRDPLSPTVVDAGNDEIVVTVETVRDALGSKNWKFRKAAYELLTQLVNTLADIDNPMNEVASDKVLESLDQLIQSMMKESNAGAFDAALRFALLYTDHCDGASQAEQAGNISEALATGPGLASARPSTSRLVKSLLLKTMEVGNDGVASIHAVVISLMSHGLISKKPKVVVNSVQLILDAAYGFGAASLPLGHIIKNASTMLLHANRTVRETAIQILAEICRAVGSKDPLEDIINDMRVAQVAELDKLLEDQNDPKQPTMVLRHETSASSSAEDALAALQAGAEEAAAEAFASRPAVDLLNELKKTEYALKMKEAKWSEKAGALDILLSCGGKKPYKLEQPSSTVNYSALISELKRLLDHTHFAVKTKSLNALSMLAEGVGVKLFANLRPLLLPILSLSKDKKLTTATEACADAIFGNIVGFDHLMETEDSLPSLMDEKSQKNPTVRTSALSYLSRCLARCKNAGHRGTLDPETSIGIAQLCIQKTKDSDAAVRTAAIGVIKLLLAIDDEIITDSMFKLIKDLENSNPRLYKTLQSKAITAKSSTETSKILPKGNVLKRSSSKGPNRTSSLPKIPKKSPSKKCVISVGRKDLPKTIAPTQSNQYPSFVIPPDETPIEVDDAWAYLASLNIDNWSAAEDEGGVVLGLRSSDWKYRKEAINTLTKFASSDVAKSSAEKYPECVIVLVKEHTKQFKESNFNILKAAMELFLVILDLYELRAAPFDIWMTKKAVGMCVEKISDKKFSSIASSLLTRLCELQLPEIVIAISIENVRSIRSPLQHEGLLNWTASFCKDFGAKALGKVVPVCTDWVVKECASSNVKVKKAAMTLIGEMHSQMGPTVKALVVTNGFIEQSVKGQVEKKMDSCPMKKEATSASRQKACLVSNNGASESKSEGGIGFEIPKTDIVEALPSDCINRMGMKEGKDSWKKRKEALEEVEAACDQYNGLISSAPDSFKGLVELVRALKSRLGDSQSNLKPLAAKNIASILGSVDGPAQGKLGKIVYGSLIAASMNENKKNIRDAALDALTKATTKSEIDGGGINKFAMEPFMSACAIELNDSAQKAVGLSFVLEVILEKIQFFPKAKSKAFGQAILKCLSSSQSDCRALAEEILREGIKNKVLDISSLENSASKLVNAEQRKVRGILDNLGSISIDEIPVNQPQETSKRPTSSIPFNSRRESASRPRSTTPFESSNGQSSARSKPSSLGTRRSFSRNSIDPRSRSISRGRRASTASSKQCSDNSEIFAALMNDPVFHPFKSEGAISLEKEIRISKQRDHIPEYPEEPIGAGVFADLKKIWSPLLSHQTIDFVFPPTGIKVQDDASLGCQLLCRGIDMATEQGEEEVILNQIDLVIRWFSYALCSRETTKGMQSLVSFLTKLGGFLRDQNYQLTDSESFILLPYLLERAGAAKGRFREMIPDLITKLVDGGIYPLERYGSMICVAVIENSTTPKTRGLAIRECRMCVECVGLGAVGKKGILLIAKSFSEESFTENKALFLDLIEAIISKMNGDIKKFLKLCGSAHLSSKAKDSIEKRMLKRSNTEISQKRQPRVSLSARKSLAPSPAVMSAKELVSDNINRNRDLHESDPNDNDGPFKFSFNSNEKSGEVNNEDFHDMYTSNEETAGVLSQEITSKREANSGAAASLRQRLRQIRNRHQPDQEFSTSPGPVPYEVNTSSSRELVSPTPSNTNTLLSSIMQDVDDLLSQSTPLGNNTEKSSLALIGLRRLHASLTNGATDSTGTDPVILKQLKVEVSSKVSFCVFKLASMLEFGFRCGSPTHVKGVSIPLISVSIAGLMAIFVDPFLSDRVSESAVSITIRQATSSLLDHRLSATSASANYGLDPSTCKKMVKAINKLAIQATHGVKRDISFQSLMSLQLQFCVGSIEQNVSSSDLGNAHHRMSRIITKLFNRVLKAESNEDIPFSSEHFDLEVVFESLEIVLSKSQPYGPNSVLSETSDLTDLDSMASDKMVTCKSMCKTLMTEILKAKHAQNKATDVKSAIGKLGCIRDTFTGRLFISCCDELGLGALLTPQKEQNNLNEYDSDHLSELIFSIGNAEQEDDRVRALEDLRDFIDTHRGIDLESHLSSLSASFRKFILEQMNSPLGPSLRQSSRSLLSRLSSSSAPQQENASLSRTIVSNSTANTSDSNKESMSMSEKLRYLKSKINAAEETAQSVIDSGNKTDMPLPPPANPSSPTTTNLSSLRQRLAVASEKRSQTVSPEVPTSQHQPFRSAALGNAAILRARLESVKRMSLSQT